MDRKRARNSIDDVIERYKESVDRTLLRENLKRTHEERILQLQEMQRFAEELKRAGDELRQRRQR